MAKDIETVDKEKMDQAILEQLEKGLGNVTSHIDKQKDELEGRLDSIKSEMDNQAKTRGEVEQGLKEKYTEIEKTLSGLKERQDAFEKQNGRLGGTKQDSFNSAIYKALEENAPRLRSFKENRNPVSFELKDLTPAEMSRKAAETMTQSASLTGEVIEPTRVPGVRFDPERRFRIRQVIPQGTTNSNAIAYVQETTYEDGVNVVAEAAAKPLSSLDLERKTSDVTKIATHFKISEEMLEDVAGLQSHISLRGTQKYFNKEDQQILYGTGTGNQLEGLTVSATDYALDNYTGDSNAQEYDILLQGVKQLLDNNYQASAALISIKRYFDMIQRKNANGDYIMPEAVIFGAQRPMVQGVPIIATNALLDNDFLVADFPMLTTLFDRRGINIRFYDQNEDDAIKNLITVVIEGRLALPTYLPGAGRYGDFAAAITNAGNS